MAQDPYKYFRIEARELLEALTRGAMELEKGAPAATPVGRLLRLAHTLKGAARVVKQPEIAELAHAVEGSLAPYRDSRDPAPRELIGPLLKSLDAIASRLAALGPGGEAAHEPAAAPRAEEPLETVRVEFGEVDALREGLSEVEIHLTSLRKDAGVVERAGRLAGGLLDLAAGRRTPDGNGSGPDPIAARARPLAEELRGHLEALRRNLAAGLDRAEKELTQAQDRATRLRLIPAGALFSPLERAARDAAEALDKRVDFQAVGGGARMDAHVLGAVRDALLHAVSNAVVHGIEGRPERVAAGKTPAGLVRIEVEQRGARVAFACRDDGRGIDVEAVRRAAVRLGRVPASEAASLDLDGAIQMILRGGVTTTGAVTGLSGRAIGLDVVRETAARLKGEVFIRSERGRGTTVELRVPITLSSSTALLAEAEGAVACIPLEAVQGVARVAGREIARSPEGDSLSYQGRRVSFVSLARVLRLPEADAARGRFWSVVLVRHGPALAAVGADRLLGTASVVVQPLPALGEADPVVAGASLDAEGNPRLVLDPVALVDAARAGRGAGDPPSAPARPPVLVIDDSLTTRMLEQSILESAGYEVDLAVSGEEALDKARGRRFGIFIVDVEMPGMDGFAFVERAKADPALRDVPSILVTSRGSPDDRRRGKQAGAFAYIVKSEFDQEFLLRAIRDALRE